MKKRSILSILVICAVTNLSAQLHPKTTTNHFAAMQPNRVAGKTTALNASRCIAMVQSFYNGASYDAIDSQTYAYSGGRGGSPMGQMKYDNSNEYSLMSGLGLIGRTTQTFDSHNNVLVNTEQHFDLSSGTYVNYWRSTYTYDAMNNPLTEINEYWNATVWENTNKIIRTFTAANKVATETELQWNGSSWDNDYYIVHTYSSLHDPIVSIKKFWNISTSTFELSSKDTMAYDLSNNLIYELNSSYMGTWTPFSKTSYSSYLASGLARISIVEHWDAATSTFTNYQKDSFSYNSNNLPVYVFEMTAGAGNTWEYDGQAHLYYELYTSGVTEISNTPATADIYPNPCNSQLNIAAPYLISYVSISNMSGQAICNYEFSSEKVQVNISDLPSGAYIIRINGTEARKFVKQ